MEDLLKETKRIMKQYGIFANKNLGQNFLIDATVMDEMIGISQITKKDLVIEIGPGLGTLTKKLLEQAKKVIAIEIDSRMVTILEERFFSSSHLEILHQDILKLDIKQKIKEEKEKDEFASVKIVANLPYYITTPILMKLLEEQLEIESITVMIQKEVAERICSLPGEKKAGAITYRVYYYAEAEQRLVVPHTSFLPEPEVESEIIQLTIRKNPPVLVKNEKKMFKLIQASFQQRRKTLANVLVNYHVLSKKEEASKMLQVLGFDEKIRGEDLTMEQFAIIADYFEK